MEVEYKGFKGEKVVENGKEKIVLAGEELDDLVWIENDEIRATNIESLQKTLKEYNITNPEIKEEKFHPGLMHFIVEI